MFGVILPKEKLLFVWLRTMKRCQKSLDNWKEFFKLEKKNKPQEFNDKNRLRIYVFKEKP